MKPGIKQKILLLVIISSLAVKFALCGFAAINAPSAKLMPDTSTYIEPGINLVEKGVFATFNNKGNIRYEINRTPGYPLFIAALNRWFGLSFNAIVVIQILLITLAGYIVYKTASGVEENTALLAVFIFVFDQPTTISTLMLLTEALYAVFMAVFIYYFLRYLREKGIGMLMLSAVTLVIATYIRPVSYYLGVCIAFGIFFAFFRPNAKKAIAHGLIFFMVFYSLIGLWQYRNYIRTGNNDFTIIDNQDLSHMGLLHKYKRDGGFEALRMSPAAYYANRSFRSALEFFTLPGTLKYLKWRPLRVASKIYGYPWMVFWLTGLFFAAYKRLEYRFLLLTVLYFMAVSVFVVGLCIGSRFRVPVMPLLSILSASGWMRIIAYFKHRKEGPSYN